MASSLSTLSSTKLNNEPNVQQGLRDSLTKTPRYLYRTYCSSSAGINCATQMCSQAIRSKKAGRSLEQMTSDEVRKMLTTHLLWCYDNDNNFVSWTSSLLFALQRAIYAVQRGDEAINVRICILDTWGMGTETFYHAETLLRLYSVPSEGKLLHRYYTAEFLSIGTLNLSPGHTSDVVSFSKLVESGLYNLVPHLRPGCGKAQLCIPVSNIRAMYFNIPTPISEQDIQVAKRLAQFMCPSLVLSFFTNLLSLQKRDAEDELFKAGWKALIEQGAGSAFVREDPALRYAVDEDVIEFAKMWKAGQKAETPVGKNLSDMLSNMSIGETWDLNDEGHFEDPDYHSTYSIWDDQFEGYGDNESDTDDEVEESNTFDEFSNAYN